MSDPVNNRGVSGLSDLGEGLGIAWDAMRANKLRSVLTVMGVAVGVSVVVLIAAVMTGLRSTVMSAFEAAGPNNFMVMRFDPTRIQLSDGDQRPPWWNKPEIEAIEADRIRKLPTVQDALFGYDFSNDIEFEGQRVESVQMSGYTAGWSSYQTGDFIAGRDYTPAEVLQNKAVVVINDGLAEELFGQRDPVGRRVRISNPWRGTQEPFTVIGVYQLEDNIFGAAINYFAVVPWTAAERRLRQSAWQAAISVVPEDGVSIDRARDDVIQTLRGLRGLGPSEENDFGIVSAAQMLDMINQITGVFFLVILLLASTGLLVGGVGVIGIMLISVTERTREIGIRKAVGATRREILWQFLVEAGVLTACGAGVGMMLGGGGALAVTTWTPVPAQIPVWAVVTALGMAALTGMLFGLLPAYRASRLEPVAALRFE